MRHLNNGTDHRHSKSCCDQSSPARRTIITGAVVMVTSGYKPLNPWWNKSQSSAVAPCNARTGIVRPPQSPVRYSWWFRLLYGSCNSTGDPYTAGHLHTAVSHCWHSRAPIVHTAVPRENNEHGCVYLRCRAVCKLPGCVEGHPWTQGCRTTPAKSVQMRKFHKYISRFVGP